VKTSIRVGDYAADIYCNDQSKPHRYNYVITRIGQTEILNLGQAESLESAQQDAENVIRYMTGNAAKAS
jgi:hypothetical protein